MSNIDYSQVIEHLDSLEQLLELNLAENFIRVIENLSPLRNLLRLNLSGNQIKRIPGKMYPFLQKAVLSSWHLKNATHSLNWKLSLNGVMTLTLVQRHTSDEPFND
jgi:Leucine-rich repeat (LRR) protein